MTRRSRKPGASAPTRAPRGADPGRARVPSLDALRGIAIVAMVAYHFAFDLRHFGFIGADFEHDLHWIGARSLILGTFMTLVGVSLAVASAAGNDGRRHLLRVARIAACALAVSAASYLLFPRSFIAFGVLHAIVVVSLLAWPLRDRPRTALTIGVAVVALGVAFQHPLFDQPALAWIGFMTHKPFTEDYVPLAPWGGLSLVGIAAGHALLKRDFTPIAALDRAPSSLRWLGRHSLAAYMLHQPILFGLLAAVHAL